MSTKKRFTIWLEDAMRVKLDGMKAASGDDYTKLIHDALDAYSASAEFRDRMKKHKQEVMQAVDLLKR